MATKYIQGTTIKAKSEFRSFAGELIDPTTVVLKYKTPDGALITKTYSLAEISKTSTGLYYAFITLDQAGQYNFRWEGTGPDGSVTESSLTVSPSKVI